MYETIAPAWAEPTRRDMRLRGNIPPSSDFPHASLSSKLGLVSMGTLMMTLPMATPTDAARLNATASSHTRAALLSSDQARPLGFRAI